MDLNDEDRGSDAAQGLSDSPTMEASTSVTFSSPPIEQRAGNKSQYSGNNGKTSDSKRVREAEPTQLMKRKKKKIAAISANILATGWVPPKSNGMCEFLTLIFIV